MRAAAIVPAYQAEASVGEVVGALVEALPEGSLVLVVDDGSTDDTADVARRAGADVCAHPRNLGKGAALRTGLAEAYRRGCDVAISVDADGQHPASEAAELLADTSPREHLLLGIRDLRAAGAPRANQISNRISNFFLSLFSGRRLLDTQCGLRRYPLPLTIQLDGHDPGYAFEAEIILRAIAADVPIVERPIQVLYPAEEHRVSHFDAVRDPARIVVRVVKTLVATRGMRRAATRVGTPSSVPGARSSADESREGSVRRRSSAEQSPSLGRL